MTPNVADTPVPAGVRRWATGWRRIIFPGIFCFYLAQTANGVAIHSRGWVALAGYVVLAAFAIAYVRAVAVMMEGRGGASSGAGTRPCRPCRGRGADRGTRTPS